MASVVRISAIITAIMLLPGCGSPFRSFPPAVGYQPPEAGPACTEFGCPIGYTPPPALLSVGDELQREFDRCLATDGGIDCVQAAFAMVKKSKGLDERPPTGTVTVRALPTDEDSN